MFYISTWTALVRCLPPVDPLAPKPAPLSAAMVAQPQAGSDERFAHSVGEHFEAFLENYSSEVPEGMDTSAADEPAPRDYIDQVSAQPPPKLSDAPYPEPTRLPPCAVQ